MSEAPGPIAVPDAQRMMDTLQFVTELAQVTASNFELQPILDWIVARTTELLGADEGCLRLATTADPSGRTQSFKRDSGSGSWPPQVAISVMGYVPYREPQLVTPDLLSDVRFPSLRLNGGPGDAKIARFRAMLAAPLKVEDRVTGLIAVTEAKPGRQWTPSDVQLLSIVAGSSAGAIEKAQLREAAVVAARREEEMKQREAEQKAIEREMTQARDIQMSLVPSRPLALGDWEIRGRVLPARQVGGDGFLYFPIRGERLAFAIADVSGKGVAAAVLMANVQGALSEVCNGQLPIPEAIAHINDGVAQKSSGKFITLFYGEFDPVSGQLRYTNAGHNYPLIRRASGELEELAAGGLPLGMFEQAAYVEGDVALAPGDALLLYSDGITEATDVKLAEYGDERLQAFWKQHGAGPAGAFIDGLYTDVAAFRGSAAQSDDMTVVVLGARASG